MLSGVSQHALGPGRAARAGHQDNDLRRRHDAGASAWSGEMLATCTDYVSVVVADCGCERERLPASRGRKRDGKSGSSAAAVNGMPEAKTPEDRRESGKRRTARAPVDPQADACDIAGPSADTAARASRGFQIDLDELLDEFSDCTEYTDCNTGECRVKVLPTLYRILRVIADAEDLAAALMIILEVMQQRLRMVRGMVSLLDRSSGTILGI